MNALDAKRAAELTLEIRLAIDAGSGKLWVEQKRPPPDFGDDVGPKREGVFQPALPDIAPRTDCIEHEVDPHNRLLKK